MIDAVLIGQIIQMNARSIQTFQLSQDAFYKRFSNSKIPTLWIQVERGIEATAMIAALLWCRDRAHIATHRS